MNGARENERDGLDFTITGDGEYVSPGDIEHNGVHPNRMSVKVTDDTNQFISAGDHEYTFSTQTEEEDKEETNSFAANLNFNNAEEKNPLEIFKQLLNKLGPFGKGRRPRGAVPNGSVTKAKDETEEIQRTSTVCDASLSDEFGYILDEINDRYIYDFETLFDVGVRAFQEFKMQRNAWSVNTSYLPTLDVGQKVTFQPPGRPTVTGILRDIRMNYAPQPRTEMSLVIESTEELGQTEYISSNLLFDPNPASSDSDYWSVVTGGARSEVRLNPNQPVAFTADSPATVSYIEQTLNLEALADYDFTVEVLTASTSPAPTVNI